MYGAALFFCIICYNEPDFAEHLHLSNEIFKGKKVQIRNENNTDLTCSNSLDFSNILEELNLMR